MSLTRMHVYDAKGAPLGVVIPEGLQVWESLFKAWLTQHPDLPSYDSDWAFSYDRGQLRAIHGSYVSGVKS